MLAFLLPPEFFNQITFIKTIETVIRNIPNTLCKFIFSLKSVAAIIAESMRLLPNFNGYIKTVLLINVFVSVVK